MGMHRAPAISSVLSAHLPPKQKEARFKNHKGSRISTVIDTLMRGHLYQNRQKMQNLMKNSLHPGAKHLNFFPFKKLITGGGRLSLHSERLLLSSLSAWLPFRGKHTNSVTRAALTRLPGTDSVSPASRRCPGTLQPALAKSLT